MKIIYTPTNNPEAREEIEGDISKLFVGEVKLLEKTLKLTYQEIGESLTRGSATNMLALVWIYRRRHNTDLRIDDMDDVMRLDELEFVADDDEEVEVDPKEADPGTPPLAAVSHAV